MATNGPHENQHTIAKRDYEDEGIRMMREKIRELNDLVTAYQLAEDEHLQIIKDKDRSLAYWMSVATDKVIKKEGETPHVERNRKG